MSESTIDSEEAAERGLCDRAGELARECDLDEQGDCSGDGDKAPP